MVTIRRMGEADVEAVSELTARVFGREDGSDRDEIRALLAAAYRSCPFLRFDLAWVAEHEGRVVAKWQALDLELRIGRVALRMAGAQALVADPDHRGHGHPRRIAQVGIAGALEEGFDLFLGFAQRGAFYRRLGCVPVMPEYAWRVPADAIPPPDAAQPDPFREMGPHDLDAVLGHYARANARRSGSLVRGRDHWSWLPRRAPQVWVHPAGYVGYRQNEDGLEVREIGGVGDAFHAQALARLAALARARGLRWLEGEIPPDLPIARHSLRYGAELRTRYPQRSGCLALPGDPQRLLEKLAPELEARLCDAGLADLQLQLEVRCGGGFWSGTLHRGQRHERKLALVVTPGTLLQLAFGYAPAGALLSAEGPEPAPADLELLDALFPPGQPFMWLTDRY